MPWFKDAYQMVSDLRSEAPAIGRWGFLLNMPMWVGGLVFLPRLEAGTVFVLNTIAVLIAGQIHRRSRFSRLTSICHVAWLPALPLLGSALLRADEPTYYRGWLLYTAVTMAISLVLDVRNLASYWLSDDRTLVRTESAEAGA